MGANTTMEPYRAFVSDKLDESQHNLGYLMQGAFSGLGAFLAFLTPTLLILLGINKSAVGANGIPVTTFLAFVIGAIVMFGSILWTVRTSKEIPLSAEERAKILSSPGVRRSICRSEESNIGNAAADATDGADDAFQLVREFRVFTVHATVLGNVNISRR